jgi:hypothetical protein
MNVEHTFVRIADSERGGDIDGVKNVPVNWKDVGSDGKINIIAMSVIRC